MKIGIIGTRGIPNNYGGFEQFAQHLSVGLIEKGHQVIVYNSHHHSYKKTTWNGVQLIHKYDPEHKLGTIGQFIYDLNCIIDSRKQQFDVILNLGYTSSSIWSRVFPKKSVLITNMDGLEWKRSKYNKAVQRFLMYAEKLAIKHSDVLVADSTAIKKYIQEKYHQPSHFIAYGAQLFNAPNALVLKNYQLTPGNYNLLIARMEPENNIEVILDGVNQSLDEKPCLVIGNAKNTFGMRLIAKYKNDKRIIFMGPIYDEETVNNLRFYSHIYFHGHSVGGTNPSLLEAMGCNCFIAAHDNAFNKSVLQEDALYFTNAQDVSNLLNHSIIDALKAKFTANNVSKIETQYSWPSIINKYETLLLNSLHINE